MSIGLVYAVLVVSACITRTCSIQNIVRASKQSSYSTFSNVDALPMHTDFSSPTVNAVLMECPKKLRHCNGQSQQKLTHQSKCEDQLIINIRVNPSFQTKKSEKFLILDEVYDPRKNTRAKILAPYLIQISRGEPIMMYPLEFHKSIKSEGSGPGKHNSKRRPKGKKITCDFDSPSENGANDKISNGYNEKNPHTIVTLNNDCHSDDADADDDDGNDDDNDADTTNYSNSENLAREEKNRKNINNFIVDTNKARYDQDKSKQIANRLVTPGVQDKNREPSLANVGMPGKLGQIIGEKNTAQFGLIKPQSYHGGKLEARNNNLKGNEDRFKNMNQIDSNHWSDGKFKTEESNLKTSISEKSDDYSNLDYSTAHSNSARQGNEINEHVGINRNDDIMSDYTDHENGEPLRNLVKHSSVIRNNYRNRGRFSSGGDQGEFKDRKIEIDEDPQKLKQSYEESSKVEREDEDEEVDSDKSEANVRDAQNVEREENANDLQFVQSSDLSDNELFEKLNEKPILRRKVRSLKDFPFHNRMQKLHEAQPKIEATTSLWDDEPSSNRYRFYNSPHFNNNENKDRKYDALSKESDRLKENNQKNWEDYTVTTSKVIPLEGSEIDFNTESHFNLFNYKLPAIAADEGDNVVDNKKTVLYKTDKDMSDNKNINKKKRIKVKNSEESILKLSDEDDGDDGDYVDSALENKKENNFISANSEEKIPLLSSKVLVNWNDDELNNDSGLTLKSDDKYKSEYSQTSTPFILTSPRIQTRPFPRTEMPSLLSKNLPFTRIIEDPNLSLRDKLNALESIEPNHLKTNDKTNQFYRELLNSYIIQPTSSPLPLLTVTDASTDLRRASDNSLVKKKRSFVLYDDLEMRDTLLDNDYNFDNTYEAQPIHVIHGNDDSVKYVNDEHAQCTTCGGKGQKKTSDKTYFDTQEPFNRNACRCRLERNCNCANEKRARSITDTWYAVFNMSAPLPFLTTEIRVFRKRHKKWWQIVPLITLNSLSGVFANANLSILFSSHVDIFQLEKSLQLQNNQLLVPKKEDNKSSKQHPNFNQTKFVQNFRRKQQLPALSMNPNNILVIDRNNFDWSSLFEPPITSSFPFKEEKVSFIHDDHYSNGQNGKISLKNSSQATNKIKPKGEGNAGGVRTIAELGYFPASMQIFDRCPNDKNKLCLNMLEDYVPAYNIKVKLPFRENSIIYRNEFSVKIDRIISDATVKHTLQVLVDVINEGPIIQTFSIGVYNCPFASRDIKQNVEKALIPRVAQTVMFLLPISQETFKKTQKFQCDVIVKPIVTDTRPSPVASKLSAFNQYRRVRKTPTDVKTNPKSSITALRSLNVEMGRRCFCIWDCQCHCVSKVESYDEENICKRLTNDEGIKAGLLKSLNEKDRGMFIEERKINNNSSVSNSSAFRRFLHGVLILLMILLLLGLLKAVIGIFQKSVDRWGYGCVQPWNSYENASRLRRFVVNIFFFILFPFLFCCKCFKPSDEDLLVASAEWHCSDLENSRRDSDDYDKSDYEIIDYPNQSRFSDDDEEVLLSRENNRKSKNVQSNGRMHGGEDVKSFNLDRPDWALAFDEGVFDVDDDADEEANTKFVLQALVESRESLKRLLRGHSSQKLDIEENPRAKQAEEIVQSLKLARIVYRVFDHPVGNVRNIPFGKKYCIQGYFLPSLGTGYEFVNYNPLAQHRCISAGGSSVEILRPPVILCPQEFSRVYKDKLDVIDANDLFVQPPPNTPCINITTMSFVASSVAKLASEHSYQSHVYHSFQPRSIVEYSPSSFSSSGPPKKRRLIHDKADDEREKDTNDLEQPIKSQFAFNISSVNDETLDDETKLLEDESIDFVENSSEGYSINVTEGIDDNYNSS